MPRAKAKARASGTTMEAKQAKDLLARAELRPGEEAKVSPIFLPARMAPKEENVEARHGRNSPFGIAAPWCPIKRIGYVGCLQ